MNFTKTPNGIYASMHLMCEPELRVTLALCRHTYGYHREECRLTYAELQAETGLARASVAKGIKAVEKRGFFAKNGGQSDYKIVREMNCNSSLSELNSSGNELMPDTNSSPSEPQIVQDVNYNSSPNEPNIGLLKKTLNKKEKESKNPLAPLVDLVFEKFVEYFPTKPKPRRTANQRKKVLARLKNPDFVENYFSALERSAKSPTLISESWFNFDFFVKNDENYIKMLDGWMEWKDEKLNGQGTKFYSQVPAINTDPKPIPREEWGAH